jgi:Ni,Fe-hydrogenase I cytochrome b subunit
MKGLEMTMVNYVILIVGLVIVGLIVYKLVPSLGSWASFSLKSICKSMGFAC